MKNGILMTLPESDDVTKYLSTFSKEIIGVCIYNQIPIKTIEKEKVTKSNVVSTLKKLDYKMIIFNGHGSPNCIMGHKNEKLILVEENHFLLKNRITYARSCWSVMELGEKAVERNNGCFIGYRTPFMFIIDITRAANPLKDNVAKVFFETSNLVPIGLIKGHTAEESNENAKRSMLKSINKALRKRDKDSQAIAQTLWNNYVSQEIVGNIEETLI